MTVAIASTTADVATKLALSQPGSPNAWQRRKINVSQVFAGQRVGVKQVSEHVWLVTFMEYDLATSTMRRVGWSRSIIHSARNCYPCLRNEVLPMSPEWT
jgi:hypothetical protein